MSRLPTVLSSSSAFVSQLAPRTLSPLSPLSPLSRSFSLCAVNEKRYKGGCSKWKRGGLIKTSIYTGWKGQAPIPKPLYDFKSGDRNLEYDIVSPHTPQSAFKDVDMSTLNPAVRRMLSAELSDSKDLIKYHQATLLEKVQRYPGDESSLEVIIAKQTFAFKAKYASFKRNKHNRKLLTPTLITMERRRYENLMRLRLSDYDRFVWLCDVLQIDFKMKPDYEVELTEKEEILSKAHKEADLLKQDKLLEYQRFLDRERVKFEETKKETLEKLSKDLAQFGFESDIKAIVEEASR